jgi:ribosomal protein L7/L12
LSRAAQRHAAGWQLSANRVVRLGKPRIHEKLECASPLSMRFCRRPANEPAREQKKTTTAAKNSLPAGGAGLEILSRILAIQARLGISDNLHEILHDISWPLGRVSAHGPSRRSTMLEKTTTAEKSEKREKFVKLAENRTVNAIKAIRVIAKLGNKNAYQFDDSDVNKIVKALNREIDSLRSRMSSLGSKESVDFKLDL